MTVAGDESHDVRYEVVDPLHEHAIAAVEAYFAFLDQTFPEGFESTPLADDAALLRPPIGVFVVAYLDDRPAGCGGVVTLEEGVGEIKRMWVDPAGRRRRIGVGLLQCLEAHARDLGHRVVRLDTHSLLVDAVRLYRRAGYREIARYNDNPYPDHWFEKRLGEDHGLPGPG